MTNNLFDLTKDEYKAERKVYKLREKIRHRTQELGIQPDHDVTGHYYKFDEVRYPSVTGRLQILKDPALANWKMNRALDYIFQHFPEMNSENLMEHLDKAKALPQTEFEMAGSIGTAVHNWREEWFEGIINKGFEPTNVPAINPMSDPAIQSGCRAVAKFMKETGFIPLACELYLVDQTLEVGGTADDIGILDGQLCFLDLKTSNIGDKDSYFYQVALYVYMFEKLYRMKTQSWKILHASKTDGTYKLIDIPDIRKRIKEAKHILKVDKFLGELKLEKKKQPIII